MDVRVCFAITLANFLFGRSLWIEAIIKPAAQHSPTDVIIVIWAAMEVVALLTVTFSFGRTVVQIRVAVLTQVMRPHAAFIWGFAVAGAAAAAVACLVVARQEGSSDDGYTPT